MVEKGNKIVKLVSPQINLVGAASVLIMGSLPKNPDMGQSTGISNSGLLGSLEEPVICDAGAASTLIQGVALQSPLDPGTSTFRGNGAVLSSLEEPCVADAGPASGLIHGSASVLPHDAGANTYRGAGMMLSSLE